MFWQKKSIMIGGPVAVSLLLALGLVEGLFHTTEWYDIFMHSLTGGLFIITLSGTVWHLSLQKNSDCSFGLLARCGMLAGLLIASVIWEIAEVILNMTPNWTTSLSDTASDVIWAQVGGIIALYFIRAPR